MLLAVITLATSRSVYFLFNKIQADHYSQVSEEVCFLLNDL